MKLLDPITIEVREIDTGLFVSDPDFEYEDDDGIHLVLKCQHENVEIEPPCCTTRGSSGFIECGCGGMYAVHCPDCNNEDLTDLDIEAILEQGDPNDF